MAGYKTLVVSGTSYESSKRSPESRLPSRKELSFLHRISEKRAALVKAKAKAIHAGAFLRANRQEDFFLRGRLKRAGRCAQEISQEGMPGT